MYKCLSVCVYLVVLPPAKGKVFLRAQSEVLHSRGSKCYRLSSLSQHCLQVRLTLCLCIKRLRLILLMSNTDPLGWQVVLVTSPGSAHYKCLGMRLSNQLSYKLHL